MRKIQSVQIKDLSTLIKAGKGIVYNTSSGTISSKISSENFNTYIDGTVPYTVTANLSPALTFAGSSTSKFILRSLHVTNISNQKAYLTSNVAYLSGNSAMLANLLPLPVGGSAEFVQRPQLFQTGDAINLQGFDNTYTQGNGLISATFTYETISDDQSYIGIGKTLTTSNTTVQVLDTGGTSILIESIRAVNLTGDPITVKTFPGDANAIPKSYYTYNIPIPPNSSIELLQGPKVIALGDKFYAQYNSAYGTPNGAAIFVSYRTADSVGVASSPTLAEFNNQIYVEFSTNFADGTVLYYTVEE